MCLNREYFNKSLGFFLNTKLIYLIFNIIFKKVLQGKEKKIPQQDKNKHLQELYVCKRDDRL